MSTFAVKEIALETDSIFVPLASVGGRECCAIITQNASQIIKSIVDRKLTPYVMERHGNRTIIYTPKFL